jgi:DNA-binding transcriptional LysR family regulator
LEKELSTQLFARAANRITLTENGKLFYERVRAALDLLQDAKAEIVDLENEPAGEIKILIGSNRRVVTEAIESFKRQYPRVDFLVNHVKRDPNEKYDFIITDSLQGDHSYQSKEVLTEEMAIALRCDHPLCRRDTLMLSELAEERFISMTEGSCLYNTMMQICADAGFFPRVAIRTDDPYYVQKYLEMGLGIALVPSVSWKGLFSEEVVLKPLDGCLRHIYVMFEEYRYMSRAKKLFLETLLAVFEKEKL